MFTVESPAVAESDKCFSRRIRPLDLLRTKSSGSDQSQIGKSERGVPEHVSPSIPRADCFDCTKYYLLAVVQVIYAINFSSRHAPLLRFGTHDEVHPPPEGFSWKKHCTCTCCINTTCYDYYRYCTILEHPIQVLFT